MDKSQLTEQAIQKALDWAGAAEEFVASQAPELCREIVMVGRVTSAAGFLLGVALGVAVLIVRRRFLLPAIKASGLGESESLFDDLAITSLGLLIPAIIAGVNTHELLHVWLAPRVYVLTTLRDML